MGWGGGLAEGPTWENPWSLKGWGLAPTDRPGAGTEAGGGVGRRLTIGRSIVAADICGLVSVGGHHPIVVLVWAVDAHLGSPAWSAAGELGPAFVPSPPHLVRALLGPQSHHTKFTNRSPDTSKLLKKDPTSPQGPCPLILQPLHPAPSDAIFLRWLPT